MILFNYGNNYKIKRNGMMQMQKFIYKYVLRPKHEREQLTTNDKFIFFTIGYLSIVIVMMYIAHVVLTYYNESPKYDIVDKCKIKYVITDSHSDKNGQQLLCQSHFNNKKYYIINTNKTHTNTYINRTLWINDNGTINDKTYENYKFEYIALSKKQRYIENHDGN